MLTLSPAYGLQKRPPHDGHGFDPFVPPANAILPMVDLIQGLRDAPDMDPKPVLAFFACAQLLLT
jgi:hypothetical protein